MNLKQIFGNALKLLDVNEISDLIQNACEGASVNGYEEAVELLVNQFETQCGGDEEALDDFLSFLQQTAIEMHEYQGDYDFSVNYTVGDLTDSGIMVETMLKRVPVKKQLKMLNELGISNETIENDYFDSPDRDQILFIIEDCFKKELKEDGQAFIDKAYAILNNM